MELVEELKHIRGEDAKSLVVEHTQPASMILNRYPFRDDARNILALCEGSNSRGFITQIRKVPLLLFISRRNTKPTNSDCEYHCLTYTACAQRVWL